MQKFSVRYSLHSKAILFLISILSASMRAVELVFLLFICTLFLGLLLLFGLLYILSFWAVASAIAQQEWQAATAATVILLLLLQCLPSDENSLLKSSHEMYEDLISFNTNGFLYFLRGCERVAFHKIATLLIKFNPVVSERDKVGLYASMQEGFDEAYHLYQNPKYYQFIVYELYALIKEYYLSIYNIKIHKQTFSDLLDLLQEWVQKVTRKFEIAVQGLHRLFLDKH